VNMIVSGNPGFIGSSAPSVIIPGVVSDCREAVAEKTTVTRL
jgi:hypothetical protein